MPNSNPVMRSLYPLTALTVVLATVAVALAFGGDDQRSVESAGPRLQDPEGALTASARAGTAVFAAADLGSGETATGTVRIANVGSRSGLLWLARGAVQERPGPNGGPLSERLQLTVVDVTDPRSPLLVYTGGLAAMGARPLTFVGPGGSRSYSVAATRLGDVTAPAGDDPYAGSAVRVPLTWRTIPGVPGQSRSARPARVRPAPPDRRSPRLRLQVPGRQSVVLDRRIAVRVRCDESCTPSARGSLRAGRLWRLAKARGRQTRRGAPSTLRLAIPLPAVLAVRARLSAGQRVFVRLRVEAADATGNRRRLTRRLWLRPRR